MEKSSLSLLSILSALALSAAESPKIDLTFLRRLTPRSTDEISASNWRIGCETLDRDFADFEAYKHYLKPLGIKVARLQAGWAKCEQRQGIYDFAWLDRIVDYLLANGIEAALETDYGNPIYEGGGDADLAGGFPTSEKALAAWDRWVEALARHFQGRVSIWMMWNEPDYSPKKPKTPAEIAAFNVRTAKVIRRVIPDARLAGLSLAKNDAKLLEECLKAMGGDVMLFDWIVYHGYAAAPETSYPAVEELKKVLARHNPQARLWQGENGAPSELTTKFALSKIPWTEISQAKWDLRRMLGDLGHDVESSVFTICDFNHLGREMNRKGLLRADEHHRVLGPKLAYFAVQNLVSVFDSTWTRDRDYRCEDSTLAAYRYRRATGETMTVFWTQREDPKADAFTRPGDSLATREVPREVLGLPAGDLEWTDLLSGRVYALSKGRLTVPVYDSPCFVRSSPSGYSWRGFMLDEARHFFGKDVVKSYLDRMAELGLNVFHWHLTDDQGWRIDIPGFPELVQYGARRSSTPIAGTNTESDGKPYGPFFYTPEDIREIVEYADKRGIRVVPEIEFPGHVRALLAAHPEFACDPQRIVREPWCEFGVAKDVLCLGNEVAIEYCERILDRVMEIFPSEFIHIGGDECPDVNWQACAKCQARMKTEGLESTKELQGYFTRRIVRHIAAKGRRAIGWDEILAGGDLPTNTVIQCWRGRKSGLAAARAGYDVIMSPSEWCYFTFREGLEGDPYKYRPWTKNRKLPAEKMLAFSPRANFPDELKNRVLGGECCAWSEFLYSREELEYKTLTRLPAFAAALTLAPYAGERVPDFTTLIAHRGESYDAPENTLPAYRMAVERGFGFECDVYLSQDGKIFTFHDANLSRTTGGANTNRCTDVTWTELEKCNVGGWGKWQGSKYDGTRPALLEEVLELARPGRKIYVEVKGEDEGAKWVERIREVVRRTPKANPETILFISFSEKTCAELRRLLPEYKVYWLVSQKLKSPNSAEKVLETLRKCGATGVDMKFIPEIVTAEYVWKIRDAGFEFHGWTIDEPEVAREAMRRGIQTVTTNRAKFIQSSVEKE